MVVATEQLRPTWQAARLALGTANGFGYLVGALATTAVAARLGTATTFRGAMILTAVALAASAVYGNQLFLLATRAIAGAAGAAVFISGGVIASRLSVRSSSGTPITVYFAGAGLGIIASGATLPVLQDNWRAGWIVLGIAAVIATVVSWSAAIGDGDTPDPGATGRAQLRPLGPTLLAYLLFAAGYITYITFLSAYLADNDAPIARIITVWVTLGLAVVVAPLVWRQAISRWPTNRTLATVLSTLGGGAALTLVAPTPAMVIGSAAIYGATFMMVPAVVTTLVKNTVPQSGWTATLAACTTVFAAGQTAGPWVAGIVADHTGTATTLAWTAILCAAAAAMAAAQPITTSRSPQGARP